MAQPIPIHEAHHHADALDHLEEEIRSLEGVTRFGRPLRIAALVIVLAGLVAGGIWWVASPPPITSAHMSYAPATGSPIEIVEPKGMTLADMPTRFAWESVTGRLQYIARFYVKGSGTPILERMVTTPSIELTPEEQARMPHGKALVWTVVAQGKDGSTIGAGQTTFKVK
jgi:hypothetical protein